MFSATSCRTQVESCTWIDPCLKTVTNQWRSSSEGGFQRVSKWSEYVVSQPKSMKCV